MKNPRQQPQAVQPKLSIDWSRNKTDKEKEAIEFVLRNNVQLVQSILDIIDRYEKEEERAEMTLEAYESPSWAYAQADRNGARRALRKVKSLFNIL